MPAIQIVQSDESGKRYQRGLKGTPMLAIGRAYFNSGEYVMFRTELSDGREIQTYIKFSVFRSEFVQSL